MDPVTITVAAGSYLAQKAWSVIEERFGGTVVERWSKYRARQFFAAFVNAMENELQGDSRAHVDQSLDKILSDESKSEVLFDAYRRVVLSASKTLGPRIIGILTARLVSESRIADTDEEKVAMASELLNDSDLIAFRDQFRKFEPDLVNDGRGTFRYQEGEDHYDAGGNFEIVNGPGGLEGWGSWATKLSGLGMLQQMCIQKHRRYREDSDRHIDEPGIAGKLEYWLILSPACELLAQFVDRVSEPVQSGD